MPNDTLLVDRNLGAVPISRLLEVSNQIRVVGSFENRTSAVKERPVLEGNQALEPNVLYTAERDASIRYYLPLYKVAVEGDHPAVELRYKAGDGGEIGRLTITLTWTPPTAASLQLRIVEHVTSLELGYNVPVQSATPGTTAGTLQRTMALQPLQTVGAQLARSTTIFTEKALFDAVYMALRSPEQSATLDLMIRAQVGVRTWNQFLIGKPAVTEQVKMLNDRGVLFTEMLHAESLSTIRVAPAKSVRVPVKKATPEMDLRVATTRAMVKESQVTSVGGARYASATTMKRVNMGAVMMAPAAARPMPAAPAAAAAARVSPAALRTNRPFAAEARLDPAVMRVAATPRVSAAAPVAAAAAAPTAVTATFAATRAQPQLSGMVLARVNTPTFADAVASSDFRVAGVKAVPIRAAVDIQKRPAVVDASLDTRQRLPFTFVPDTVANRAVFVSGDDYREAIHILVPVTLVGPGGVTHTVYRDSLMPDLIQMAPSGFRLERDAVAPYLPSLRFAARDFSTTTADGTDAEVLFRVAAAYRLEPWLHPDLLELARTQFNNRSLQFTTATATDAKLSLDLDILGDQKLRAGATIDPALGISDSLDLDHEAFVRLWREHLSGGSVTGAVEYRLFDGSQARVPVQLSLRETSGELFDATSLGPVPDQPGRCRVRVRNRIESPAVLTGFPPELVEGGGVARAIDIATLQNRVLQPQETCDVDYEVTGATTPLGEFSPTILGRIEPNLPALLGLLMLTQGYSSMGFSLAVNAAEGAFANTAATGEPLTGLLVEFDDGTKTRLTATKTSSEVTVVGRLVNQILGTADDTQRFFYRVTNLHAAGEGARTSWTEGNGTAPITVTRAGGGFDF